MRKGLSIFALCLAIGTCALAQTAVETYNEANALGKSGKWEQAAQKYEAATQADPDLWQAYMGLGNAYHNLGRDTEALKAYDKSLQLHPDNPTLRTYVEKIKGSQSASSSTSSSAAPSSANTGSDGGFFINLYPGFDYSFQGDFVEGINEFKSFQEFLGYTATASNFPAGLVGGLEFGVMFDKVFGMSLSPEIGMGFGMSATSDDGSDTQTISVNPNYIGGSLNVLAYLVSGQSANTYIKAGFAFYHGFVDYRIEDTTPSASWGTFTGDTVGGILEIGEEFDLGGGLCLGISARGRFATISQLSTDDPQGDAAGFGEPFSLSIVDAAGYGPLYMIPTSAVDPSSGNRYATFDLTGVQVLINLKANL